MKRVVATAFASIAALGLLSACGDSKSVLPPSASASANTDVSESAPPNSGFIFPEETTTVPGAANPSGITVPQATIDLMIQQFEANGLKVDKACFTELLKDPALTQLIEASGGTPSPEVIQKFIGCLGT
jgi:ABC-type glycerol-3-phosphate transport system substrate-binding protein